MNDSVNSSPVRVGNFTSSEIYRLTKKARNGIDWGAPAIEYITEKNYERKIGRSLSNDMSSQETDWGKLCEGYVDERYLGTEWSFCGDETVPHPEIDFWAGSPDLITHKEPRKVGDIKSPFTLKSFATFAECNTMDQVRENHSDGEKYFWQLVSNAILMGCDYAELIIFVPMRDELETLRERARELGYDRIVWKKRDMELPYLIPGVSQYRNLLKFYFKVTAEMKQELTEVVKRAGSLLIPR